MYENKTERWVKILTDRMTFLAQTWINGTDRIVATTIRFEQKKVPSHSVHASSLWQAVLRPSALTRISWSSIAVGKQLLVGGSLQLFRPCLCMNKQSRMHCDVYTKTYLQADPNNYFYFHIHGSVHMLDQAQTFFHSLGIGVWMTKEEKDRWR